MQIKYIYSTYIALCNRNRVINTQRLEIEKRQFDWKKR